MRTTLFAALAAGLLLPMTAVEVSAAPAAPAAHTRVVDRDYGDGPVRLAKADVLKVRFDGRRGDQVRLSGADWCPLTLTRPDGALAKPRPDGFWRLAQRGTHTFTLTRCAALDGASTVQLQKLHLVPVPVDGPGTRLPARRGFVDAYRVRVPAEGRLEARFVERAHGASVEGLVLPDGTWYRYAYNSAARLFLEDGRRLATAYAPLHGAGGGGALLMDAGDVVTVITTGKGTAYASVAQALPMTVDAPATLLPTSPVPYREYQLEVDATAGQWLHAEVVGPTGRPGEAPILLGPDGRQFQSSSYWKIPSTGRYRLMVATAPTDEVTQVRFRTIRVLGAPMPVDGTPVTFATAEPGEWVLASMTLTKDGSYLLTSHAVAATGAWTAEATIQDELHCDKFSNGCGEGAAGYVNPTTTVSPYPFGGYGAPEAPWMVLLAPGPGVTASVELSVAPAG